MKIKTLMVGICGIIVATATNAAMALSITTGCPVGVMTCKTNADCPSNGECSQGCCIAGQVGNCSKFNCASTTWTAAATGYETRIYRACDSSFIECISTTQYRCAVGYYGSSSNGTSGCAKCPSSGATDSAGTAAITSCYLPAGTTASDTSGAYTFTNNCYYSN